MSKYDYGKLKNDIELVSDGEKLSFRHVWPYWNFTGANGLSLEFANDEQFSDFAELVRPFIEAYRNDKYDLLAI